MFNSFEDLQLISRFLYCFVVVGLKANPLRRKEVPPLVSLCPSPPGSNLTLQTACVVRSQVAEMLARMGSNFVDLVIQLMLQRLDAWRSIARLFLIPESGKKA